MARRVAPQQCTSGQLRLLYSYLSHSLHKGALTPHPIPHRPLHVPPPSLPLQFYCETCYFASDKCPWCRADVNAASTVATKRDKAGNAIEDDINSLNIVRVFFAYLLKAFAWAFVLGFLYSLVANWKYKTCVERSHSILSLSHLAARCGK